MGFLKYSTNKLSRNNFIIVICITLLIGIVTLINIKPTKIKDKGLITFQQKGVLVLPKNNSLNRPLGVTVDSNGDVYVADSNNHRTIIVYNTTGKKIKSFGKLGNKTGELNYPNSVAASFDNKVFISDFNNNRIQVIQENGKLDMIIPTPKSQITAIKGTALAFDNQNNLYVTDVLSHQVLVFDSEGNLLRTLGKGYLNFPNGIAIDNKHKEIYVADFGNYRIVVFDWKGKIKRVITQKEINFDSPRGLAFDDSYNLLYITDTFNNRVLVVDKQNRVLDVLDGSESGESLSYPNSVYLDKRGILFIADRENNRIVYYLRKLITTN